MSAPPEIVVETSPDALARGVAAGVVSVLERAQRERGQAGIALTGGSILEQVFSALAADPDRSRVEWDQVDVFWGDERFVDTGSDERNDVPARRLLLEPLGFDDARVFSMPAADGPDGLDLEAAAERYAALLVDVAAVNRLDAEIPTIDVALIGIGPDGHCCSLFPDHPALQLTGRTIVAVRDSPKPPPDRLSFTFETLESCREVWVIAAGDGKADAVARALGGADRVQVPSAGARGHDRTRWLLDQAAAAGLPR